MPLRSALLTIFILAILACPALQAASFSFTGNFNQDDDVQLFNFTVGAQSDVTFRTWSYAGGVNAAGATIARGGFDPILAVFASTGLLLGTNDDGGGSVAADLSGQRYDTFFTINLVAGNYTVSVMQYNNFAVGPNLSNGFGRAGQGNFTPAYVGASCSATQFCDVSGSAFNERDSHWAFDILNVADAVPVDSVPEPSTAALIGLGALVLGSIFRRRGERR